MEQPENNDEVVKGDVNLKYLNMGKTVTRRHAELVKTNDGKNDTNTTAKKGGSKTKKSTVEQPAMVRWELRIISFNSLLVILSMSGGSKGFLAATCVTLPFHS